MDSSKLIVVSNRLPVVISRDVNGDWMFSSSSGGLVSAIDGLKDFKPFIWLGWPGGNIALEDQEYIRKRLGEEFLSVPIFVDEKLFGLYYNGFANGCIWPLFHSITQNFVYNNKEFIAYERVNETFAEAIMEIVSDGDSVWIHDYHLMSLPYYLRTKLEQKGIKNVNIGFFLHIPFPTIEILKILPNSKSLLESLLHSDIVGFHTYDFVKHFSGSCLRLLGLKIRSNEIRFNNKAVKVDAFPIGIAPNKFQDALSHQTVRNKIREIKETYKDKIIIIGVDRGDYTKGIINKFRSFDLFITNHPEYRERVVLIQVMIPTRTSISEYKELKARVDGLVGNINGKHSSVNHVPINILHRSISFEDLVALYSVGDICMVTPIMDGMNLVCYEYIACKADCKGVLILSEFAGASNTLSESILVNPWDIEDLSRSIHRAIVMPDNFRIMNFRKMLRKVNLFTAKRWGMRFINNLESIHRHNDTSVVDTDGKEYFKNINMSIAGDQNRIRLYFICYNDEYEMKKILGDSFQEDSFVKNIYKFVSKKDLIYIVSKQSMEVLEGLFDSSIVGLLAEGGAFLKHPKNIDYDNSKNTILSSKLQNGWIEVSQANPCFEKNTLGVIEYYKNLYPGSYTVSRRVSLEWYYRDSTQEINKAKESDIRHNVESMLSNDTAIVNDSETVLLLCSSVNLSQSINRISSCFQQSPGIVVFCGGPSYRDYIHDISKNVENVIIYSMGVTYKDSDCLISSSEQLMDILREVRNTFSNDAETIRKNSGKDYPVDREQLAICFDQSSSANARDNHEPAK